MRKLFVGLVALSLLATPALAQHDLKPGDHVSPEFLKETFGKQKPARVRPKPQVVRSLRIHPGLLKTEADKRAFGRFVTEFKASFEESGKSGEEYFKAFSEALSTPNRYRTLSKCEDVFPQRLFKTEKDREACSFFLDVVNVFEQGYHRELTFEELVTIFVASFKELDPHSATLTKDQAEKMEERFSGKFIGIGAEVQFNSGDEKSPRGVLIISPIPDYPAEKAGLKAKDVIMAICEEKDGHDCTNTSSKDYVLTESMSLQEAVDMLRGEIGTDVHVMVWRKDVDGLQHFSITRSQVQTSFVKDVSIKKDGGDNFGYLRITEFGGDLPEMMRTTMAKLERDSQKQDGKPLSGLIIDVRSNPGGRLDAVMKVLDDLLDRTSYNSGMYCFYDDPETLLSTERRGEITKQFNSCEASDLTEGKPIIVLINGGSASASEILAGVLKQRGRAVVVGVEPSFGKGSVQQPVSLKNGGLANITISQYMLGPVGCETPIQNVGVKPDILLEQKEMSQEIKATRLNESRFINTIPTSTVSNKNCKYHFELPPGHMEAAYRMIEAMGLKPAKPAKTQ